MKKILLKCIILGLALNGLMVHLTVANNDMDTLISDENLAQIDFSDSDRKTLDHILDSMKGGSKKEAEHFSDLDMAYELEADHPSLEECFNEKVPALVQNIIQTLKNPTRFAKKRYGRLEKNLILHGPPGTGKTTVAQIIAKETGRKLFGKNAGTFQTVYQASEVASLKNLFDTAKKYGKPCIVFIDEIDGIMSALSHTSKQDNNKTLKALIGHLDEVKGNSNIYVIATTNYLSRLDKANADRFFTVEMPAPKGDARNKIIKKYLDMCEIYVEGDLSIETNRQLVEDQNRKLPEIRALRENRLNTFKLVLDQKSNDLQDAKQKFIVMLGSMFRESYTEDQLIDVIDKLNSKTMALFSRMARNIYSYLSKIENFKLKLEKKEAEILAQQQENNQQDNNESSISSMLLQEVVTLKETIAFWKKKLMQGQRVFCEALDDFFESEDLLAITNMRDDLQDYWPQVISLANTIHSLQRENVLLNEEYHALSEQESDMVELISEDRIISKKFFNFLVTATTGLTGRSLKALIKDAVIRLDNGVEIDIQRPGFIRELENLYRVVMFYRDFRKQYRDFMTNYWPCSKKSLIEQHLYACLLEERSKVNTVGDSDYEKDAEKHMKRILLVAGVASVGFGVAATVKRLVPSTFKRFIKKQFAGMLGNEFVIENGQV